jgi:hypothetical protein
MRLLFRMRRPNEGKTEMNVMTKPDLTEARSVIGAPELAPTKTPKPPLLSVEDAKSLDVARMTDLFKAHLNPGQLHFMKLLGFHKVKIERAEGMYYYDQNGRAILDFFGGFGSLAFGHNHPRIAPPVIGQRQVHPVTREQRMRQHRVDPGIACRRQAGR